jgi:hypothetical protein
MWDVECGMDVGCGIISVLEGLGRSSRMCRILNFGLLE